MKTALMGLVAMGLFAQQGQLKTTGGGTGPAAVPPSPLEMLQSWEQQVGVAKDQMNAKALEAQNATIQYLQAQIKWREARDQAQAACKGSLEITNGIWKCKPEEIPKPVSPSPTGN